MNPGDIYTYYSESSKVNFTVTLLSSDTEPGWETDEKLWRCAQFQTYGDLLFGAQIVIYTEFELQEMTKTGTIISCIRRNKK